MNVSYSSKKLERLCSDPREATKMLGPASERKLRARLADLRAANRVTELPAGSPHPLTRERSGQYAVSLSGGHRLVFRPMHDPVPARPDGSIAWEQVTAVEIVFMGDYHE